MSHHLICNFLQNAMKQVALKYFYSIKHCRKKNLMEMEQLCILF